MLPTATIKVSLEIKLMNIMIYFRRVLAFYSSVFSVISTGFLVMHPKANAFALMTLALPALVFLCKELKR